MKVPDITIPPEAVEAAARELTMALVLAVDEDCRACALTDDECMEVARAACLAMLKHWPGMWHINAVDFEGKIILPLPKEGFTEGHCEHRKSPGGCQLHNLQCGYPDCDRRGRKHE